MPDHGKHKKGTPDWVKRAGRRSLTSGEASKVEAKRVDQLMARKLSQGKKSKTKTPQPSPSQIRNQRAKELRRKGTPSGLLRLTDALDQNKKKESY